MTAPCYSWLVTASRISDRPIDAVLCDVDNVIRFYDTAPLTELERAAGLPEGTTADVAFAPELDLPLLLGKITTEKRVHSVASALTGLVPARRPESWGRRLQTLRPGAMTRSWTCCAGYAGACPWFW